MTDLVKTSYIDSPCDRCGGEKSTSKTWLEESLNSMGKPFTVEVSQTICVDTECQEKFDRNREKELAVFNERKLAKAEQDKKRKENIAQAITKRKSKNHID